MVGETTRPSGGIMESDIAGFRRVVRLASVAVLAAGLFGLAAGYGQADARTKLPSRQVAVAPELVYDSQSDGDSCIVSLMAKWKDVPGGADLESTIRYRTGGRIERLDGVSSPFDDSTKPVAVGDSSPPDWVKNRSVASGFHWMDVWTVLRGDSQGKACEKATADIEEQQIELISFEVAVGTTGTGPAVGKKCKKARKNKANLKRKVAKARGKKAKRLKKQLKRAKAKVRRKC
jgi:hypothetical protein